MKVSVLGKNNIMSKREIRYMVSFFGNLLLGPRLSRNVKVTIQHYYSEFGSIASVIPAYEDERNPREFRMHLNTFDLPKKEMIAVFGHEMVHIKQYAFNELRLGNSDFNIWKGKKYKVDYLEWDGTTYIPNWQKYTTLPWETEAMESEYWLTQFYTQHVARNGLEF